MTAAAVATLATLTVPAATEAGGWAVTSLDPMTGAPAAGEEVQIGFTIRQHGRTPVAVDDAAIVVTDAAGHTTRFAAVADGAVGHYVATVEFPTSGRYEWSVIQGWFGPQDLGAIDVASSSSTAGGDGGSGASPGTLLLGALAAILVALGLFDLGRSTARHHATA